MARVRLDSWKTIAAYLDRSLSTVQRWHESHRLPIYHVGGTRGSVFAYSDELEAWLAACRDVPARSNHEGNVSLLLRAPQPDPGELPGVPWAILSEDNLGVFVRSCRDLFTQDPRNAAAFAEFATLLAIEGLTDHGYGPALYARAASALEQALRLQSPLPATQCASAWMAMARGRAYLSARTAFQSVLAQIPHSFPALLGRGILFFVDGELDSGLEMLETLWRSHSLSGIALAFLAWGHSLRREHERALSLAAQARASGEAHELLASIEALALLQTELSDSRLDRLSWLVGQYPGRPLFRGVLGCAYARAGLGVHARELYHDLARRSVREDANYGYALAVCASGLQEPDLAARWLARCASEGALWNLGLRFDPVFSSSRSPRDPVGLASRTEAQQHAS